MEFAEIRTRYVADVNPAQMVLFAKGRTCCRFETVTILFREDDVMPLERARGIVPDLVEMPERVRM